MRMKFYIRYLGMRLEQLDLEPGSYIIGRSPQSDIHLTQEFISRRHARLFYQSGEWFFQFIDRNDVLGPAVLIDHKHPIELGYDLDLVSEHFLSDELTVSTEPKHVKRERQFLYRRIAIGISLMLISGVVWFLSSPLVEKAQSQVDPKILLEDVRPKIVEFVANPKPKAIAQFQKYGGFAAEDFKEHSGFCTGFIVAPDVVLTASHCVFGSLVVDTSVDFKIRTYDGKFHEAQRVLGFDVKRDYLFLEIPGLKDYGFLKFAKKSKIGEKVFTIGNVHGEGIAIRDGLMASETQDLNDPSVEFIRYSAAASPGNSGGPLVNTRGQVVALVFAGTSSENYNVGTPHKALRDAFEKYATDRDLKDVKIEFNRVLNFNSRVLLEKLGFPNNTNFDEHPEAMRNLESIQIVTQVPAEFVGFDRAVLNLVNADVSARFDVISHLLDEQGLVSLEWNSYVSQNFPAIIPSQFGGSKTIFKKLANGQLIPKSMALLDGPTQKDFDALVKTFEQRKQFEFQAYSYLTEALDRPLPNTLQNNEVVYVQGPFDTRKRIWNYALGTPFVVMKISPTGQDEPQLRDFKPEIFMKYFFGSKGVIANSFSPLLRPKSEREFSFKAMKEDFEQVEITDGLKRVWIRSSVAVFDRMTFDIYCRPLPEGAICLSRIFPTQESALLELSRQNYAKYWLPSYIVNPYFWRIDPLVDYMNDEKLNDKTMTTGFEISKKPKGIEIELSDFGLTFKSNNLRFSALRLTTGLLGDEKEQAWVGYGFEGLRKKGKDWFVCGGGVEIDGTHSNILLNLVRDQRKKKKDRTFKTRVWLKENVATSSGRTVNVYGYCAPFKEDSNQENLWSVQLKDATPYEYSLHIQN